MGRGAGTSGTSAPRRPRQHPSHEPIPGHPESVGFAAERQRIDEHREHMSAIRPHTDIIEFERMFWEQAQAHLRLAEAVAGAGGLDPSTGAWGTRYVVGIPERCAAAEATLRRICEQAQAIRDEGRGDGDVVAFLEEQWGSPFEGPRPV